MRSTNYGLFDDQTLIRMLTSFWVWSHSEFLLFGMQATGCKLWQDLFEGMLLGITHTSQYSMLTCTG